MTEGFSDTPPQVSDRDAGSLVAGDAGAVSERRAIVHPPSETGGRPVRIADRSYGTAHTPYDRTLLAQNAGWPRWDERDVADSDLDERHEGGPEWWPP
ncbi:hypothetical protein RKD20_008684 [Streptomyces sp. SLBN-8D4]